MNINNKNNVKKIKKIFFMVAVLIAIAVLALFLYDYIIPALAGIGVFSLWYLFFHVANFQYIEYSDENNKLIIRFYKIISFERKRFNSIEFPQSALRKAYFETSVFGKTSDVTLIIKTKKGVAEYPSISLLGSKKADRFAIENSINSILKK